MIENRDDLTAERKIRRSKLDEFQRDLWSEHDSELPANLYHYSTPKGICGILCSRQLWMSDVLSMVDDKKDGRYWLEPFRRAVHSNSVPSYIKYSFDSDGFGLGEDWYMYISCFSDTPTSDHLWQEYGDEYRGCAIEVPSTALSASADGGRNLAWMRMLYDRCRQEDRSDRTVKRAVYLAREQVLTTTQSKEYWDDAVFSFVQCGLRLKDPKYVAEGEWRVFVTKPDLSDARCCTGAGGKQIFKFPFGPEMVTGIVRGRNCEMTESQLLSFLKEKGYPERIVDIDSPTPPMTVKGYA